MTNVVKDAVIIVGANAIGLACGIVARKVFRVELMASLFIQLAVTIGAVAVMRMFL